MKTIVITGAHCVGKTLLCEQLIGMLSDTIDVKMIPEMARILIANGIQMNDKADEFAIVSYIVEYLRFSRETTASLVISDRSVFDLLSYISVSRPTEVREQFVKLTEEIVHLELARVDTYVYIPIEFPMQVDEVRPADRAYQKKVDQKIRELLKYFEAKVFIASGTIEQRAMAVRKYLNV